MRVAHDSLRFSSLIITASALVAVSELLAGAVSGRHRAVLPIVLIFMRLVNDPGLIGRPVNSRLFNVIAWITVVVMIVLTIAMLVTTGSY